MKNMIFEGNGELYGRFWRSFCEIERVLKDLKKIRLKVCMLGKVILIASFPNFFIKSQIRFGVTPNSKMEPIYEISRSY